jgi:hypothetical protein
MARGKGLKADKKVDTAQSNVRVEIFAFHPSILAGMSRYDRPSHRVCMTFMGGFFDSPAGRSCKPQKHVLN